MRRMQEGMEQDKHYQTVTDRDFNEFVVDSNQPVLLVFTAEWSGPCHIIDPIIIKLGEVYQHWVKFYRLDVENNIIASQAYGIRDLPTLLPRGIDLQPVGRRHPAPAGIRFLPIIPLSVS